MEAVAKDNIPGAEDTPPALNGVNGGEDDRDNEPVNDAAGDDSVDSPVVAAEESNATDSPAKPDSAVASAEAAADADAEAESLVAPSGAEAAEEDLDSSKPEDNDEANSSAASATGEDDADSHTPTLGAIAEESREATAAAASVDDDGAAADTDTEARSSSESAAVGAVSTSNADAVAADSTQRSSPDRAALEDEDGNGEIQADDPADYDLGEEEEEEEEEDEEEEDESMAVDEDNVNGGLDNSLDNDVQHVPIVNEVHAISDSESEDDEEAAAGNNHSVSESNQPEVEHMDVDGSLVRENGHSNASAVGDKEDKPVSIGSDSDNDDDDDEMPTTSENTANNGLRTFSPTAAEPAAAAASSSAPGPLSSKVATTTGAAAAAAAAAAPPTVDDDDDEDDCMVIEDDDDEPAATARPPMASNSLLLSPRRSGRSRKSIVQARDTSTFDDDIEEIADDPLSAPSSSKRLKTSPGGGACTSSSGMSLTIQNARSLAFDPLASGASSSSSSHHHHHAGGVKKEPTLIMIDQLMRGANAATAASVQALQSQNISVHPVPSGSGGGGHVYPTNLRASITPVPMATITKSSASGSSGAHNMHSNNSNCGTPNTTITKMPMPGSSSSSINNSLSLLTNQLPAAAILPALSDDMYVLEAPSFIVPYIYEKPPGEELRDIVDRIGRELAEQKKQEDIEVAENEAKEREAMTEEQRKLAELAKAADANKKKQATANKQKRGKQKSGDESWDESDTSTDDEASDTDQPARTKVLIQEADTDPLNAATVGLGSGLASVGGQLIDANGVRRDNYFESPLGRFFMDIGVNLVQEHVQTDLLRQQKKKMHREGDGAAPSVQMAINSLTKNLEHSKTKNDIFKFETKRCEYCNFKSESALAMAHHYEAPHLNGQMYRCNFCPFEARPPYDILFHMEAMHNVKARLDKAQTYHQCPNCPFEDNGKSKLARHAAVCLKKYRPEVNLNPPLDWEPPAKIPRIKPRHGLVGTATAYQAMAAQVQRNATNAAAAAAALSMQQQRQAMAAVQAQNNAAMRGRGRPQLPAPRLTDAMRASLSMAGGGGNMRNMPQLQQIQQQQQQQQQQHLPLSRQQLGNMGVPNNYHLNASGQFVQTSPKSSKNPQQPSISITPLPRQPNSAVLNAAMQIAAAAAQSKAPGGAGSSSSSNNLNSSGSGGSNNLKPGQAVSPGQKSFVICEICDGYIKDLDQLRNHMQWMHKVKIHPKMIYNRPPLNCQKCQFRFFTDQGLERHLLGSHGLVTSSMQEAANKGKDAGRCPVCGRMYQWKLLNHVSRDHNMTLKPAHLSYKCTVCTATFGMYKQFENHVYSAHSTVAKKAMDGKTKNSGASGSSSAGAVGSSNAASTSSAGASSSRSGDSLLKPLKINDEITIIPQPATSRQSRGGGGGGSGGGAGGSGSAGGSSSNVDSHVIEIL